MVIVSFIITFDSCYLDIQLRSRLVMIIICLFYFGFAVQILIIMKIKLLSCLVYYSPYNATTTFNYSHAFESSEMQFISRANDKLDFVGHGWLVLSIPFNIPVFCGELFK